MSILITGASSGIGRSLTIHYLSCGLKVAAVARRQAQLEILYQESQNYQGLLKIYVGDVTDRERMVEIVESVEQELGAIDLVIANAGMGSQQLTEDLHLEEFQQVLLTNLIGVVNTLVPVIPKMIKRRQGHLVAISSLAGVLSIPRVNVYGASKASLNYLLEGLSWHLKFYQINVTTICPGFIETEMTIKHQVPHWWMMNLERSSQLIVKAIAQKKRTYYFPYWAYLLLKLLGILPQKIQNWLVASFTNHRFLFPKP